MRLQKAIDLLIDEFGTLLAIRARKNKYEIKEILKMEIIKIEDSDEDLKQDFIRYGFLTEENDAKYISIRKELYNIIENSKALNHLHARYIPDKTGSKFTLERREDLTLIDLKNELLRYISKKTESTKPLYEFVVAEQLISFVRALLRTLEQERMEEKESETLKVKIDFAGMAKMSGLSENSVIEESGGSGR